MSRLFFERVVLLAWASMKSCVKKEGSSPPPKDGGRNPTVDFKRSNAAHVSTTEEARLYKKSEGDQAQRCFMGHALMENRSGLVVDVEVTHATGTAERDAAKIMMGRTVEKPGATLGADKAYDVPEFVHALRNQRVTPHVARKDKGSAIDGRATRHPGYRTRLKRRKRVEELFGWSKTVGGLRQTRFRGLKKVAARVHVRRLQPDPVGWAVRLAVVDGLGGVCPTCAERRQESPSGGMKTGSNRDFRADRTFSTKN